MSIDIAAFEEVLPDPETIRSAMTSLKTTAESISTSAVDSKSSWSRLQSAGVYDVPGEEIVFGAFDPVATAGEDLESDVGTVDTAVGTYADAVDGLKTRLEGVKADYAAFASDISGRSRDDWDDDENLIQDEQNIIGALDQLFADLQAAQRECANAISSIYGGPTYVLTTEDGVAAGEVAYGYTKEQLDAAAVEGHIPWGQPTEWDKPWYKDVWDGVASFGKGVWSGITGTVTGLGNMVGFGGADAFKQTWAGLGKLAFNVAIVTSPVAQIALRATGNSDVVDQAGEELLVVGKAAIHWDEWQSDPAYAAGATTFDLASILLTAGAGAVAKTGSVAGKIGTVANAGGKAAAVVNATGITRIASYTGKVIDLGQTLKINTITVVTNAGKTTIGTVGDVYRATSHSVDNLLGNRSPQPAFVGGSPGSAHSFTPENPRTPETPRTPGMEAPAPTRVAPAAYSADAPGSGGGRPGAPTHQPGAIDAQPSRSPGGSGSGSGNPGGGNGNGNPGGGDSATSRPGTAAPAAPDANTPRPPAATPDAPDAPEVPKAAPGAVPDAPDANTPRPPASTPDAPDAPEVPKAAPGAVPDAPDANAPRPPASTPDAPEVPKAAPGAVPDAPDANTPRPPASTPDAPEVPKAAPGAVPDAPDADVPSNRADATDATPEKAPSSNDPAGPGQGLPDDRAGRLVRDGTGAPTEIVFRDGTRYDVHHSVQRLPGNDVMNDLRSGLASVGKDETWLRGVVSKNVEDLSTSDLVALLEVRRSIPVPDALTVLQKVMNRDQVLALFDPANTYRTGAAGYISKADHTSGLRTPAQVHDGLRLDYENGKPVDERAYRPDNEKPVYAVRFQTPDADLALNPDQRLLDELASRGVTPTDSAGNSYPGGHSQKDFDPNKGGGFTGSTVSHAPLIPEYKVKQNSGAQFGHGAEMWEINKSGTEVLVGIFDKNVDQWRRVLGAVN